MERILELLRPHLGRLALVIFLLLVLAGLNMVMPVFIKLLIDRVFPHNNWTLLWFILGGIIVVYLMRNLLYLVCKYRIVEVGEDISFYIRNRLFERLQRQSLHFYRKNRPGDITSRVMNDTFSVQAFIQDEAPTLLQSMVMFVGLVAIIYAIDWELAMVSTVVLPLHLMTAHYLKGPIKEYSRRSQEQLAVVQGNLIEKFLGVEVVKGFTGEARENRVFRRATERSRRNQLISRKYHTAQKVIADLLIGLGTIGLLGFGAYQVMGPRQMSPGTFIAFFSYVLMLYPVVIELMSGFAKLTRVTASTDRIFELMDAKEELETRAGRRRQLPFAETRRIAFERVSFRFAEEGPWILRDIDFEIPAGQVCAIVGSSGAGKSTLISLIPRFIQPTSGRLLIDGVDASEVNASILRREMGISFQESFLFQSTILENLRYARPSATFEEIKRIASLTGVEDLIERLPNGFATKVGEKGVSLSRGEKQAITLARALLKDPRVLILDEATASLDPTQEERVLTGVLEMMKNRTILLITHKTDLIRYADRVVHLEEGRVVFAGAAKDYQPKLTEAEKEEEQKKQTDGPASGGAWLVFLFAACLLVFGGGGTPAYSAAPEAGEEEETAQSAEDEADAPAEDEAEPARPAEGEEEEKAAERPRPRVEDESAREIGRLIAMGPMNRVEVEELLDVVMGMLEVERGYRVLGPERNGDLPSPPRQFERAGALSRTSEGAEQVIQFGFRTFVSQPPRVWVRAEAGEVENPTIASDVAWIEEILGDGRATLEQHYQAMRVSDLAARSITLSYIDVDRCLALLKGFGFQTIEFNSPTESVGKMRIIEPTAEADLENLPIIFAVPEAEHIDLVSGADVGEGVWGMGMMTGVATPLEGHTSASPGMEILVMYHPARPEQFSRVENLIRQTIDVPARQILIEAMVLEISQRGLRELGVEWTQEQERGSFEALRFGRLLTGPATLDLTTRDDVFGLFQARLQALVTSGEAEILSRPSVLTLDNRQASIRVGEEIPVATSLAGLQAGDKVSFEFRYIPVGILLNVRPRINATGEEVTMQIDGSVSAQMAGEDIVILDQQGQQLARAPRISTRRVQTYSRVTNSTPFIIGGLISRNQVVEQSRVPLLGDIPLLGMLFRHTRTDMVSREVVIVLTPFVLDEGHFVVDRRTPEDDDAFDAIGQELFRDSYRVRTDDVFDLDFLMRGREVRQLQRLADLVASQNYLVGERYPFNRFTMGRIPGENILVYRQIYNVVNRLEMQREVDIDRVIFFQENPAVEGAYSVAFLGESLRDLADGRRAGDLSRVFRGLQGQAVAITFTQRDVEEEGLEVTQPTPEVRLVACPDRETWDRLLWELNQPDEDGMGRRTILLQNEADLSRLQSAIQVKAVVRLNAENRFLRLNQFTVGRQLIMPTVTPERIHLIDVDTARYFFYSQHYYPAQRQTFRRHVDALIERLRAPEMRTLIRIEDIPEIDWHDD